MSKPQTPAHCTMKAEAGPCDASLPRYYYDSVLKRCELFLYGGCEGNRNNFESQSDCERECNHGDSAGLVRISVELPHKAPQTQIKDHKDVTSKLTNSQLITSPETTIAPSTVTTTSQRPTTTADVPSLCYLPAQTGCDSSFTRFFYNSQSGQCESFLYGGCRPNENNFMSIKDCQQTCMVASSQYLFPDQSQQSTLDMGNARYIDALLSPFIL